VASFLWSILRRTACRSSTIVTMLFAQGCSSELPAPPPELKEPAEDVQQILMAIHESPLAMFHPNAAPSVPRLGQELRRHVLIARSSVTPRERDQVSTNMHNEGANPASSARLAGRIVGTLEAAFACADAAKVSRNVVDPIAVMLIVSANAYGVNEELPQGGDALAWVQSQNHLRRLLLQVRALSLTVPGDLHSNLETGRMQAEVNCPVASRQP
jgi:hypothetical protein